MTTTMTYTRAEPPTPTPVYCRQCGRPLTSPASRERRLGPDCAAWSARVFRTVADPK
jgi:hypothetical protein